MRTYTDMAGFDWNWLYLFTWTQLAFAMQSGTRAQTVQYGMVQYGTVQNSTVQYSTVQNSTVQYSTVQYSTVQYSTVQYSTAQHSTVMHSTAQQYITGAQQCSTVMIGSPPWPSQQFHSP